MKLKTSGIGLLLTVIVFGAASCATYIPVQVTKPAEINMTDARKIAVLDFDYPRQVATTDLLEVIFLSLLGDSNENNNTPQARIADYTTQSLLEALKNTGYFELVDSRGVVRALAGADKSSINAVQVGQKAGVKAIVVGKIGEMVRREVLKTRVEQIKDTNTGVMIKVDVMYRVITDALALSYRVLDTSNGVILATKTFSDTRTQEIVDNGKTEPLAFGDQCKDMVNGWIPQITRQLAPYTVTEYRTLMNDKAKDPDMKVADELVKKSSYAKALALFLQVWESTGNPAAGVNAAIMYDVTGDMDQALSLLQTVIDKSPNPTAIEEMDRLKRAKADAQRLAEQTK
jgi:hypothetical protein